MAELSKLSKKARHFFNELLLQIGLDYGNLHYSDPDTI